MKLVRIATLVLLAAATVPVPAAEGPDEDQEQYRRPTQRRPYTPAEMEEDEDSPQARRRARRERSERQRREEAEEARRVDPNDPNDPNDDELDPNAPDNAKIGGEVEESLSDVLSSDKREVLLWSRDAEQRTWVLAETVYQQVEDELKAVKELASEEGAAKTVEAIDLILENRAERLEDINQRIKRKIDQSHDKERGAVNRGGHYERRDRPARRPRGRDYGE